MDNVTPEDCPFLKQSMFGEGLNLKEHSLKHENELKGVAFFFFILPFFLLSSSSSCL